ncbi:uncharacterized protein DUF3768 [Neolewinella xylanilytica]|uniref:Uncharacterized protein DUF3768 n=1 Tax=Neolewinella xylanilytica TaxID=1514080 RepID=A0A2S6HZS6_9BACT|nr:DUF3768 domain-containing protein [Neolewinella xylanilytica]PPK83929.1 uncharacterized protein DUF3768 [Neolewinella xylanilytica]
MSTPDPDEFDETTRRIAALNDDFRTSFNNASGNHIVATQGIHALPHEDRYAIFDLVRSFDQFAEENDPHGQHDFGRVTHNGQDIFWKIDAYDKSMEHGSPDPSDPSQTTRVMTIMLANEY